MIGIPKQILSYIYNILNWFRINFTYLGRWQEFRPPKNGQPTVLMVSAEPGHPFYETWRQGVEANGWNVRWLEGGWKLPVSHKLFLYFLICPEMKAIHLIDLDLQGLFGEHNALRRIMSFTTLRLIALWPRLLGKRVVYSFGNFVPHEHNTSAERRRHQLICSLVEDVISVAPFMTDTLIQSGIAPSRIWPVEHADIKEFFPVPADWPGFRSQYNIPENATVLLHIGSIRPYKGIEIVITAFKNSRDPNLRLVIAGKPSVHYTTEGISELVQGDKRIILGPLRGLSNEEMGWMFQASDWCLLAYRNIGHSGLICQSLGLGVPVISSRVGSLSDYLNNGAGILFAPGGTDELASIIDNLQAFDFNKARTAGLRIMQQRTPERVGQRLVKVYEYRRGGPMPETNWLF